MKLLDVCTRVSAVSHAITSAVVSIAALVAASWISIMAIGPQRIVIADIDLPPPLSQRGYTTTIVARHLLDEVGRLREASAMDRAELALFERASDAPSPPLQATIGGAAFGTVEQALRLVSGNRIQTIVGEIVEKSGSSSSPFYEGRLRLGDVVISDRRGALGTSSLDKLIQDMAFDIYRNFDPVRAAYAAWTLDDLDDMRIALRQALASSNIEDRKYALTLRSRISEPLQAEADLREVIRLDPGFVNAFFLLAELERQRGDLGAAEDHVMRGLAKDPRLPQGLYQWGRILEAQGRLADALAVATEACRFDGRSASGCNLMGEILLEQASMAGGSPQLAKQAYDAFLRALKIDESHHTALANAAHAAASFGDHPEALILIDTALAKSPASIPHLLRKTWILLRKGDQEAAERLLSELMGRYPDLLLQPPGSRSEAQLRQELAGFLDARAPD